VLVYTCLNIPVIPCFADSGLFGSLLSSLFIFFTIVKNPIFTKRYSVLYFLICKMGYLRRFN